MKSKIVIAIKWIGRTILVFLSLIALYLLSAWALSLIVVNGYSKEQLTMSIYIKTNGVHTDIVVPTKNELIDWSEYFEHKFTKNTDSTYQYLGLGWGDKGFYLETPQWSDLKISTAFNAAFGLGSTAIHATYYRNIEINEDCKRIDISKNQYQKLIAYVFESLDQDSVGKILNIKTTANYGSNDAFFEATGSYSVFHTCNTWANNALKASEQKACFWTPFDWGIFSVYE